MAEYSQMGVLPTEGHLAAASWMPKRGCLSPDVPAAYRAPRKEEADGVRDESRQHGDAPVPPNPLWVGVRWGGAPDIVMLGFTQCIKHYFATLHDSRDLVDRVAKSCQSHGKGPVQIDV